MTLYHTSRKRGNAQPRFPEPARKPVFVEGNRYGSSGKTREGPGRIGKHRRIQRGERDRVRRRKQVRLDRHADERYQSKATHCHRTGNLFRIRRKYPIHPFESRTLKRPVSEFLIRLRFQRVRSFTRWHLPIRNEIESARAFERNFHVRDTYRLGKIRILPTNYRQARRTDHVQRHNSSIRKTRALHVDQGYGSITRHKPVNPKICPEIRSRTHPKTIYHQRGLFCHRTSQTRWNDHSGNGWVRRGFLFGGRARMFLFQSVEWQSRNVFDHLRHQAYTDPGGTLVLLDDQHP